LRAVLRRGMSRDPAARFTDMTELLTALGRDRQRRTRWIAVGGGLALTAAFGGLAAYRLSRAELCDDADAVLEGVWDGERKSSVESSFEREGKKYTAASWRNVERTLDEYADSLAAMRREACEASRVHGTQSDEILGRRMACLDRRLHRLSALTGALAEGGTTTVLRAVEAAHGLPDIELCADVERLAKGVPPPDDPVVRAQVDEIRLELDRLEGLGNAGKTDDLLPMIDAVMETARDTEYRPLVAETLLLRGNFFANFGRMQDARTALLEALDIAEREGHDHVIARTSMLLIFVEGSSLNHFDVADVYVQRAAAVIERMGNDPKLQVDLWSRTGTLQIVRGDHAEAAVTLQRAADLARESGETGPQLVTILNPLASALLAADRLDEAAVVVEEARTIVDTEMGPDHPNSGVLLSTLGRLRDGQKRYEEALVLHRRAREVFVAALGPNHANVGATANAIGLALASLGRDAEALAAYEEALAIIEGTNGPEHLSTATALTNIAYQHIRDGQGREAIELLRRVIAIREPKLGRDDEKVGLAKDLLGDAYALVGDRELARTTYREAVAIFEKLDDRERQAYASTGLAKLLLAERRYEDAVLATEASMALMGDGTNDADRGEARFTLAKALHAAEREPARVRELVAQAERDFGEAGASRARDLAEVRRWAKALR
jgi:tetratricopeptide (TPR) repeat protein